MSGTLPSPLLPSRVGSGRTRTQGLPVTRLLLCQHLKELPNMLCGPLAPHLPVARPREAVPTAPLRGPTKSKLVGIELAGVPQADREIHGNARGQFGDGAPSMMANM